MVYKKEHLPPPRRHRVAHSFPSPDYLHFPSIAVPASGATVLAASYIAYGIALEWNAHIACDHMRRYLLRDLIRLVVCRA